jgi:hypothetical protein
VVDHFEFLVWSAPQALLAACRRFNSANLASRREAQASLRTPKSHREALICTKFDAYDDSSMEKRTLILKGISR